MDHDQANPCTMKPGHKSAIVVPTQIKSLPVPKMPKALTEHKLKRLNILTFINDKKEILFTKKAFKHEKERIWRQIFSKMLEFGMVSKEKDWRYVRDVSFSNWRKRAQKRLKHLAANGYRLNMDECEFLIYDILGKTPDKMTGQEQTVFSDNWLADNTADNMDEDESDEYMIDSDEDDEDDVSFDEMLFVPKIVFNDNIQLEKEETDAECQNTLRQTPSKLQQSLEGGKPESEHGGKQEGCKSVMAKINGSLPQVNGNAQRQSTFPVKGLVQVNFDQMIAGRAKLSSSLAAQLNDNTAQNFEQNSDQESELSPSSPSRYMNKFRELRLLDLEIENKVLKNRYMKLKIFQMEQSLGLEHCKEVKDLSDFGGKTPLCKSTILNVRNNEQGNDHNSHHKLAGLVPSKSGKLRA